MIYKRKHAVKLYKRNFIKCLEIIHYLLFSLREISLNTFGSFSTKYNPALFVQKCASYFARLLSVINLKCNFRCPNDPFGVEFLLVIDETEPTTVRSSFEQLLDTIHRTATSTRARA